MGVQGWKGRCWVSLGFRCFHEVLNIGSLLLDAISIGYLLNPTYGLDYAGKKPSFEEKTRFRRFGVNGFTRKEF